MARKHQERQVGKRELPTLARTIERPPKLPPNRLGTLGPLAYMLAVGQSVRGMTSDDTITLPVNILGTEKYGSLIYVRNVYKKLYNKIVWNKMSRVDLACTETRELVGSQNKRSYNIAGTPGK